MTPSWTAWRQLAPAGLIDETSLAETLDGGQAFRWRIEALPDGRLYWSGIWAGHLARLRLSTDGCLESAHPIPDTDGVDSLRRYLGLDRDWPAIAESLPWRSDGHLAACQLAFPTLRLLSQPFAETLLCFLCSATKQIPQIKIMCENLARAIGTEIFPGIHRLPTWLQIAAVSEQQLRDLGLGFRAKNIKGSADHIAADPALLDTIAALPYAEAKLRLMLLPGVGEKIADCALLFGAQMYQAFPVDTWILKVLALRYGLIGWSPSQLAQFGRVHYGPYAGYAQQFLFAYERSQSRSLRPRT